jgi:hypothetical protein
MVKNKIINFLLKLFIYSEPLLKNLRLMAVITMMMQKI